MLACACIAVDAQRTTLASIAKRHHLALAMFGAKLPLHPDSFRVLELYTERFLRHYVFYVSKYCHTGLGKRPFTYYVIIERGVGVKKSNTSILV